MRDMIPAHADVRPRSPASGVVRAVAGLVVASIVALAAPVHAQETGRITGTVFDSLLGRPLAGAQVWTEGGGSLAFADSAGAFTLEGVPAGSVTVVFGHEELDSIGLMGLGGRTAVPAGGSVAMRLATPSFATFYTSMCPRKVPVTADSAIVYGIIQEAESEARLSGARAVVAWMEIGRDTKGALEQRAPMLEALTDGTGRYAICGVPTETVLTVQAQVPPQTSGPAQIGVGSRRLARLDLSLSRQQSSQVRTDAGTGPAPRGLAVVAGVVRDSAGNVQAGAEVALVGSSDVASVTNANGQFVLGGLPAGTQTVEVRMLGFAPAYLPVHLRNRDTVQVGVTMQRVTILNEVRVDATGAAPARLEFESRRRAGFGTFLDEDDMKRRQSLRTAFQGIPSVRVASVSGSAFDYRIMMQTRTMGSSECEANLYIDGRPASYEELRVYQPEEIVGVEVYARASTAPQRYVSLNTTCGVVLIWTKRTKW